MLDLVKGLGQDYGVTCDNFFTSFELAKELEKQNKTLLGTIIQIRKEVPKIMFPSKSREVNSSLFLFSKDETNLLFCCLVNITIRQLALQNMLSQILYWITTNLRVPLIVLTRCSKNFLVIEFQKVPVCCSHLCCQCLCFKCLCTLPKEISKYSTVKT